MGRDVPEMGFDRPLRHARPMTDQTTDDDGPRRVSPPPPPPGLGLPAAELVLGCRLEDLSAQTLDRMVEHGLPEGQFLEFKPQLLAGTHDGNKELVNELAALANAGGVCSSSVSASRTTAQRR